MRMFGAVSTFVILTFVFALGAFRPSTSSAKAVQLDGQAIFRYDTFGDEQLWTDTLKMQMALLGVSPKMALSVGLKVDSDALPPAVINAIKAGQVNIEDPAVTIQLLKLNAVVGVIGKVVGPNDHLATVGITCALCHSTVDNSVAAGIGRRLDGWANTELDVGAIVALSPALAQKSPFSEWGRRFYDPRFHAFDGSGFITLNPTSRPVVIPAIYGLGDVDFETYTADGPISYWNDYVAVGQMGGQGSFSDDRGAVHIDIMQTPDLVQSKLPALFEYQRSLLAPPPPAGSFNEPAAQRGRELFMGAARCGSCHKPPTYTDVDSGPSVPVLHAASETGMEEEYARRSATLAYRTTPLRALWQHPPYFHDGSARTLEAVVEHYDKVLKLGLNPGQKRDLAAFLKSL